MAALVAAQWSTAIFALARDVFERCRKDLIINKVYFLRYAYAEVKILKRDELIYFEEALFNWQLLDTQPTNILDATVLMLFSNRNIVHFYIISISSVFFV